MIKVRVQKENIQWCIDELLQDVFSFTGHGIQYENNKRLRCSDILHICLYCKRKIIAFFNLYVTSIDVSVKGKPVYYGNVSDLEINDENL